MRKLLLTVFALTGLFTFNAHAVITSPSSNAESISGTVVKYDKIHISVKNVTGATISNGELLFADSTGGDTGMEATKSTTRYHVPLCVADGDIAKGAWGKCQVWGYHAALDLDVTGRGAQSGSGVNAGAATLAMPLYASPNNAGDASGDIVPGASDVSIGFALDSSATSGTIEAFIKLL